MAEGLGVITQGYDWGNLFDTSLTVFWWSLLGSLIVGTIVFIWWVLSFNHTLVIKRKVGEAFTYKRGADYEILDISKKPKIESAFPDIGEETEKEGIKETEGVQIVPYVATVYKAKIKTKKGIKFIQPFLKKLRLKIPDSTFQAITRKGKRFIELTQINEKLFAPTVLLASDYENKYLFDESWFAWVVTDMERDQQKYYVATFWDKYGNWIMTAGMLMICMIIIVVTLKYSQKIVETAKPLASALAEAAKEFAAMQNTQPIK